jgi:putative ABC transport system substrate-binding protein
VVELVNAALDVIVANSSPVVVAETRHKHHPDRLCRSQRSDGSGLRRELGARPGGNITGFTFIAFPMLAKWPDLLKEMVPTSGGLRSCLILRRHLLPRLAA